MNLKIRFILFKMKKMFNLLLRVWLPLFMLVTRNLTNVYFFKNCYYNSMSVTMLINKFNQLPIQATAQPFQSSNNKMIS